MSSKYVQFIGIILDLKQSEDAVEVHRLKKSGKKYAKFTVKALGSNTFVTVTVWEEANLELKLPYLRAGNAVIVDGKYTSKDKENGQGKIHAVSISNPKGCNIIQSAELLGAGEMPDPPPDEPSEDDHLFNISGQF